LEKINELEYGEPYNIYELYDTREVVDEFYEEFEDLRTDLIQEVSGIDENRGDAKERFVQVQLDRLLFLYFIQEKGLLDLNQSYLDDLHQSAVKSGEDVYESWFKPLFFDALGEGKRRQKLGNVPHLNGGLFSQSPIEGEFPEAKLGDSTEETNNLYREILDFLGDWNWHVDERLDIVDERISPEVLGHIFEQSVNQKEMGAYYTPKEITSFMASKTVHPYLLDRLNEEVGESYEELDDVFGIDAVLSSNEQAVADGGIAKTGSAQSIQTDHAETLYFDILKDMSVLDPAVGSGAFLLAVQEVLLDTYLSCIEHFQSIEPFERTGRVQNELEEIEANGSPTLFAKHEIILNNLYGVDIDQGAVEICKLRLWLSMVADIENDPDDVEPLPNIEFNIRQGNSLVGYTEITDILSTDPEGNTELGNFGGGMSDRVRDNFEEIIEAVEKHKNAVDSSDATDWRNVAESRIDEYRQELNQDILEDFHDAGIEDADMEYIKEVSPFHWVLEFANVYSKGGFDVLIGNPPWEVLSPDREDYFTKYDELFRTRMPEGKDQKQEELLEDEEIAQGWEEYKERMGKRAKYFNNTSKYDLQSPKVAGRKVGNENELSALFFERVFQLARDESYVSQILPSAVWNGASCKDLRLHLLDETQMDYLSVFVNKGTFEAVDDKFFFGLTVFKNSGSTDELSGTYERGNAEILRNIDEYAVTVPRDVLEEYSPESATFPYMESQKQIDTLDKIVQHPSLGENIGDAWMAEPYRELDRSQDSDRFTEDKDEDGYPVYGGKNIYQYAYDPTYIEDLSPPELWSVDEDVDPEKSAKKRICNKNLRKLKRGVYNAFDGTGSQVSFVNELLEKKRGKPLSEEDVLLDSTEYRLVFRNITNAENERTMILSVIPKGIVCHHAINTIRPYRISPNKEDLEHFPLHDAYERIFSDEELFVALGLLNSIPFDYLMRSKISENLVMYKFKESQVPRLTEGDDWFEYIWTRSARLNCYGDEFEEMRERLDGIEPATEEGERREIQAEIDAGAFHAYGLGKEETEYILDNFHRVENPRMMTESYFELVKKKYSELEEN